MNIYMYIYIHITVHRTVTHISCIPAHSHTVLYS